MPLSLIRQTRRDISVPSKSLILVSMLRIKKEVIVTTLPSFSMPRDLKTYPSSTELEISSECTEQHSDYTINLDNSMLACFITVHGLCSQVTRNLLSKKSEVRPLVPMKIPHSHFRENTIPSRSMKLHYYKILENGLPNIWVNTTSLPMTWLLLWTRLKPRKKISMWSARSYKSSRWTSTQMNSSLKIFLAKHGTV